LSRVLAGISQVREPRPAALGITRSLYSADVTLGTRTVRKLRHEPRVEIETTPRVGIRHCADWPLRFVAERLWGA